MKVLSITFLDRRHCRVSALLFSAMMTGLGVFGSGVRAATLYWDGDGAGVVGGDAGTWDTTLTRWSTTAGGSTYQAWVNATNDDAVFSVTAGNPVTLGAPISANSLTFSVSGYVIFGNSTNVLGSSSGTLTLDAQTGTNIVNAFYSPATATIIKNGAGILSSGTPQTSFAGKWVVNAGLLSVAGDTRLGVVPGAVEADQVTLNGGSLRSSTANVAFSSNRGITLGATGGGIDSNNTTFTWAGPIAGSAGGPLTKAGTANLVLSSNTSTYDGTTFVNAGRLTVGAANALGAAAAGTQVASGAELLFDGAGTTFTLSEPVTIAGAGLDGGSITIQNSATPTLSGPITLTGDATVTVAGSATGTFSHPNSFTSLANQNLTLQGDAGAGGGGTITGTVALGSGGLTKLESGTWTLSGNNTYTGSTTISAGTLDAAAAGALGSTSGVAVASGSTLTLSGSGNLDRVNNSAGISLAGGSILKGSGASEGSDAAIGLGSLSLSATSTIDFGTGGVGALAFTGFVPGAFSLTINNWTGTANTLGNASTDRLIFGSDQSANLASFNFNGFASGGSQFAVASGYEIVPVPEASTVAGALVLLVLAGYRERRYLAAFGLRMRAQ